MFRHRVKAVVLTGIIVLSTVASLFLAPQKAYAAGTLLDTARGWSVLKAVIDNSTNLMANPTKAQIDTCRIFRDSKPIGQHVSLDDGIWNVSTPPANTISSGLNAVGIAGCSDLVTTLGYTLEGDTYHRGGDRGVNDGLDRNDVVAKLKAKGVESNLIGSDINSDTPSDTIAYIILYQILTKTCGWQFRNAYVEGGGASDEEKTRNEEAKKNSYYGDTQGQHSHTYTVEDNKAGDNTYYVDGGREDDIYLGPGTSGINMNEKTELDCADNNEDTVGGRLSTRHQYADAYARYIGAHPDAQTGFDRDATPSSDANGGTNTCGIKTAIGWILCPVMTFLASMLDKMYEFIAGTFLVVPADFFDTNNGTYKAWQIFRDYANVAFIIAFLIIVYSQVTSIGISNYGIKKLLPKLIIAAVLVNVSFFVCQALAELTNLLGYGIKSMFDGVSSQVIRIPGGGSGDVGDGGTVAGIIVGALALSSVVVIAVALGLIIPALLAVGMTFLILLIRQALIVILIVLSPLAFVAWLLPNTESLFKKWWDMYLKTLMVFPIIALIFGGAKLASVIIAGSSTGNITQLIGVGVATIPLFLTLPALNAALKSLPVFGKKLQNMGDKASGKVGKKASAKSREKWQSSYLNRNLAERKKIKATRQAMIAGGTYRGRNPVSRVRSAISGRLNKSAVTGRAGDRMATMGEALEDKEFEESVSAATSGQKNMLNSDLEALALGKAGGSEAEQVAAARQIMSDGNHEQRMSMIASSAGRSDRIKQSIRDGAYKKGMSSYLGGGIGDAIMSDKASSQADLDNMIAKTAESGKLTADGLVADGSAANRIHAVLQAAKSGANQSIEIGKDENGNAIMHTVQSTAVSANVTTKGIAHAKKAAQDAQTLPATRGRIAGNMTDSIKNMSNF